jgi:long-chain acyl-CoA synthetase
MIARMSEELGKTLEALATRYKAGTFDKRTTYYLSLGEGPGEKWTVTFEPTSCEVRAGKVENADCVLKTSADLFRKLVAGTWKPGVMDVMQGKIKTSNVDLLQRLQQAFGL